MAKVEVLYDHEGGTIWANWDRTRKEEICTDADPDSDVVISIDKLGNALAFEYYTFPLKSPAELKVKVYHDHARKSLTVWFGDPVSEASRTKPVYQVVLIKDGFGKVIGVEKLQYSIGDTEDISVSVDTYLGDSPPERPASQP